MILSDFLSMNIGETSCKQEKNGYIQSSAKVEWQSVGFVTFYEKIFAMDFKPKVLCGIFQPI